MLTITLTAFAFTIAALVGTVLKQRQRIKDLIAANDKLSLSYDKAVDKLTEMELKEKVEDEWPEEIR